MKNLEKFLKKIAEILEVKKVSKNDNLSKFENWDSLSALSVIALVNEMYKISISVEKLEKFSTLAKLCDFVESKGKK